MEGEAPCAETVPECGQKFHLKRQKTWKGDVDQLAAFLTANSDTNHDHYGTPNYMYSTAKLEDRPRVDELTPHTKLLCALEHLSEGKYYCQSTMQRAWSMAHGDTYREEMVKRGHPCSKGHLSGVCFTQV